jgi:hypothetical protein
VIGAGAGERTVGDIINRLYQQILTPPDNQMAQVRLGADVTDPAVELIMLGTFTVPEDEGLLSQGSILELNQELVRVIEYDSVKSMVSVTRGEYGTIPAVHSTPLLINLNPPYTRASMFEAVADNIIQLYPSLSQAGEEMLSSTSAGVFSIGDDLAVEVLSITPGDFTSTVELDGRIVDFHPMTGGRSLITNSDTGSVWLRYRKRMGKATSEADLLSELGVDERWATIVLVGAAADLIVGRDVPAAQTEWIKSVLEAENIRVGSRMSIAGGLRQYRGMLINEAMKEMKAEYRPKISMRNTFKQVQ